MYSIQLNHKRLVRILGNSEYFTTALKAMLSSKSIAPKCTPTEKVFAAPAQNFLQLDLLDKISLQYVLN